LYQTLKMRLVIESSSSASSSLLFEDDDDGSDHGISNKAEKNDKIELKGDPFILYEMPLHPTLLRRLPNSYSSSTSSSVPSSSSSSSSLPATNTGIDMLPKSLPPNSIIIQYTDNSLRVHPNLYRFLLSKNIIQEPEDDTGIMEDIMEENRRARRFDDDVFDVLDNHQDYEEEGVPPIMGSPSGLLGDSDPNFIRKHISNANKEEGKENDFRRVLQNGATPISTTVKDDIFDLLGTSNNSISATEKVKKKQEEGENQNGNLVVVKKNHDDELTSNKKSKLYIQKLKQQVEMLQSIAKMEEESLKMDQSFLCKEMKELKFSLEKEQEIERETTEIRQQTVRELENLSQTEFVLEARRMKLLRDLREIYPICAFPDNTFAIRGIKLPTDILDPTVPDEQVSAALGFACHLVFMCSKYLAIPLRYRLICNSSRSAVQDDGNGVFPLFKERVIDLKQLERAVILFERNIECLLHTRGVSFSPLWHLLAKLDQLFERTTKGGGKVS